MNMLIIVFMLLCVRLCLCGITLLSESLILSYTPPEPGGPPASYQNITATLVDPSSNTLYDSKAQEVHVLFKMSGSDVGGEAFARYITRIDAYTQNPIAANPIIRLPTSGAYFLHFTMAWNIPYPVPIDDTIPYNESAGQHHIKDSPFLIDSFITVTLCRSGTNCTDIKDALHEDTTLTDNNFLTLYPRNSTLTRYFNNRYVKRRIRIPDSFALGNNIWGGLTVVCLQPYVGDYSAALKNVVITNEADVIIPEFIIAAPYTMEIFPNSMKIVNYSSPTPYNVTYNSLEQRTEYYLSDRFAVVSFRGAFNPFDSDLARVGYGLTPNPTEFNCNILFFNASYVECRLSGFTISYGKFTAYVADNPSVQISSTDTIIFPPPVIMDGTLRRLNESYPITNGTTQVPPSATPQSEILLFDAMDFGGLRSVTSKVLEVFFGPVDFVLKYKCIPTIDTNDTTIFCRTEVGIGAGLVFTIRLGFVTVTGRDTYSFPVTPEITSIRGCPGDIYPAAFGCRTTGETLTITGFNLLPQTKISFLTTSCENVAATALFGTEVTCTLPPGTGQNMVVIPIGSFTGAAKPNLLSYALPSIAYIEGCVASSNTQVTDCSRKGISQLTIYGRSFGTSGASVYLGGIKIVSRHIDPNPVPSPNDWERLVVDLPPRNGNDFKLSIQQLYGQVQEFDFISISYEPCPSGTRERATDDPTNIPLGSCISCNPGYISATSGQRVCEACRIGKYAPSANSTVCLDVPSGYFTGPNEAQTAIFPCGPGTITAKSSVDCAPCPVGTYNNMSRAVTCDLCDKNTYTDREASTVCLDCPSFKYQPAQGQSSCISCDGNTYAVVNTITGKFDHCETCEIAGVICTAVPFNTTTIATQIPIVSAGHNTYLSITSSGIVKSYSCVGGRCRVCNSDDYISHLQSIDMDNNLVNQQTVLTCCGANRLPAVINPLCAACISGYAEQSGDCVECFKPNSGIIFGFIMASWIYVIIFHHLSQQTNGINKVFLYYVSACLVIFGSDEAFINWFALFNFNLFESGKTCVAPFTDTERLLLGIIIPAVCLGLLLCTFLLHLLIWYLLYGRFGTNSDIGTIHADTAGTNAATVVKYVFTFNRKFHKSPYLRTLWGLGLFSFNSVSTTILKFFACIEIEDSNDAMSNSSYIVSLPAISCESDTYKSLYPLFIIMLVVFVISFPILLFLFLYYHHRKGLLTDDKFLRRYGILFETYKLNRWWYEIVVLIRRAVLIGIGVALTNNRQHYLFAILTVVNVIIFFIHTLLQPFGLDWINNIECLSLAILSIITALLTTVTVFPLQGKELLLFSFLVFIPGCILVIAMIIAQYMKYQHRIVVKKEAKTHQSFQFASIQKEDPDNNPNTNTTNTTLELQQTQQQTPIQPIPSYRQTYTTQPIQQIQRISTSPVLYNNNVPPPIPPLSPIIPQSPSNKSVTNINANVNTYQISQYSNQSFSANTNPYNNPSTINNQYNITKAPPPPRKNQSIPTQPGLTPFNNTNTNPPIHRDRWSNVAQ